MAQRQAPQKPRTQATSQRGWPVPMLLLLQLLGPCACYGMALLRGSSATHVGLVAQAPAYGSGRGNAHAGFPAPHTHGAYGHGGIGYGHSDSDGGAPQGEVGAGGVGGGGSGPELPLPPTYPLQLSPTPSPFHSPPPSTAPPPPSYPPLAPPPSPYPPSAPPPSPPPPPPPPSPPPLHSSPPHATTPAGASLPPQPHEPPGTPPQPSAAPLNSTTQPGSPPAPATPPATQPPALPPVQPPPAPIPVPVPTNTSGPVAFLAVPSSLIDPANPSAVLVVQTDVLLLNTQATDPEALSVLFPGAATVTPVAQSVQATLAMEPKPESAGPSTPIQAACVQLAAQVEELRRTLQAAYPASEIRMTCFSASTSTSSSSSNSPSSAAAPASAPATSPSSAPNASAPSPSSSPTSILSPSVAAEPVRRSLYDTASGQRRGLLGPTTAGVVPSAAASAPSQLTRGSNGTTRPAGAACATSLQVTVRSPLVGTQALAPTAGSGAAVPAPAGGGGAVALAAAAAGSGGSSGVPEGVYGKLDTWGGGQASYGVPCGIKMDVSTQVRAEYRVPLSSAGQDALRPGCSGGAGSGGSLLFLASGSAAADATTSCQVVLAAPDSSGTAGPAAPGAPVADLADGGAAGGPRSAVLPAAVAAGVGTALAAVLVAAVVALRRKRRRDAQEELEADINKARTQPSYIDVWSSEGSAPRRPLHGSSTSTGRTPPPTTPSPLTAESSTPSAGTPQRVIAARSGSQALMATARPPLRGRALILYQQTFHQGDQQQQQQQQPSGMLPPHSRPSRLRTHSCDDAGLQMRLQRRALMQRRATMDRERPSQGLEKLPAAAGSAAGGVAANEQGGLESEASEWASRRGSEGPRRGASWDAVVVAARARGGPARMGAGAGAGGSRAAVRGPVILEREEAGEDAEQLPERDSPVLPGSGACSLGGSTVSGDAAGGGGGGGEGVRSSSRGALATRHGGLGATHPVRSLRHDAEKLEALRVALGAATRSSGASAESGADGTAPGGGARVQSGWSAMLRRSSNRVYPQQQPQQEQQRQQHQEHQRQRQRAVSTIIVAHAGAPASSPLPPLPPLPPAAWGAVSRAGGMAAVEAAGGGEAGGAAAAVGAGAALGPVAGVEKPEAGGVTLGVKV